MICFSCRWAFTLWILADTKLGAPNKDHAGNSKGENDTLFDFEANIWEYPLPASPLPRWLSLSCLLNYWQFYQGLEGYSWNTRRIWPKYSAGKRGKRKMSWRDRDLTTTKETRFAKMLTRAVLLGKRAVFGIEITEIRDMTRDCRELGNAGSGSPLPDPCLTMTLTLNQYH